MKQRVMSSNIENKIFVYDYIIGIEYQENIKNILMGSESYKGAEFPWFWLDDVTAGTDDAKPNGGINGSTISITQEKSTPKPTQKRPALCHNYYTKFITNRGNRLSQPVSDFHQLFVELIRQSCFKLNLSEVNVIQGRSFLQFPLNLKSYDVDTPHIDLSTIDHFVMLYYVCDSDGDTVIYNEKDMSDHYTEQKRVTPKQGRVVLFDGSFYHTAEQCRVNNRRCIVNYDLE